MSGATAIAVVGMAGIFPGAPDIERFWRNICEGVDATSPPPAARLDPVFHQLGEKRVDRLQCWKGGFIDEYARFDPYRHGLMPASVATSEPEQLLSLEVAYRALVDAGYERASFPKRTAVLLGRGNYASSAKTRFEDAVRGAEQLVQSLRTLLPELAPATLEQVRSRYHARLAPPEREAVVNLVPNLAAARIAERFDLQGPAYTIDAACASSLVAIDQACAALRAGGIDVALAGGVHLCHAVDFWSVFEQVDLLSVCGISRPLDRRADGLLVGEGVGFVVLKREDDARKDGDRIYASIVGSAVASDGRGTSVVRPSSEGQLRTLSEAWRVSGRDPRDLGLLEAHATGTQVGDAVELETMRVFLGGARRTPAHVGSVKSMIGHAMPAAGIAGIIKTVLATYHGVLPPTLHCEQPREELGDAGMTVVGRAEPWGQTQRTSAVNAFGFGGINAHVVLTSAPGRLPPRPEHKTRGADHAALQVACYAAGSREALLAALRRDERGRKGTVRALIVNPTPARREVAANLIEQGRARHGGSDVYYSEQALLAKGGRIACMFPGFDAAEPGKQDDIARWLDEHTPEVATETNLEARGRAILAANRLSHAALIRVGLRFDVYVGHSVGEWNALEAAGVLHAEELERLVNSLEPGSVDETDCTFVAIGGAAERAQEIIGDDDSAAVSHDNCPHQSVIACLTRDHSRWIERFASHGLMGQRLPFGSGVHSRFFRAQLDRNTERLASVALRAAATPVYSATTCEPYPDDPARSLAVIVRHMIEPVRFRELVERLYADGVRIFVQPGAGPLASFVSDTLRARPHLALSACRRGSTGMEQLARLACSLWVEGGELDWDRVGALLEQQLPDRSMALSLGAPLVRFDEPLHHVTADAAPELSTGDSPAPWRDRLRANLELMARAQHRVVNAHVLPRAAASAQATVSPSVVRIHRRFALDTYPELVDHAFYRQPPNWKDVRDTFPVVPMTAIVDILTTAAREVTGDMRVAGIDELWARRWLAVGEPVEMEIVLRSSLAPTRGSACVEARLGEYAEATVQFEAEHTAPSTFEPFALTAAVRSPVTAAQLYADKWMFHGPAYQSVVALDHVAADGICGTIAARAGIGSLLDGAGQMLGLWLMLMSNRNRLGMPVRLRKLRYHAALPAAGVPVTCSVRVREVNDTELLADMRIGHGDRLCVTIEGWEDRRFETDDRLWQLIRWPEHSVLADVDHDGRLSLPVKRYTSANTYALLVARYLTARERRALEIVSLDRRWPRLLAHIAVKDAVRLKLRRTGRTSFPIELSCDTPDERNYVVQFADDACVRASVETSLHAVTATLCNDQSNHPW